MSDAQLRDLERRWKETGAEEDKHRYLLARCRIGECCGHQLEEAPAGAYVEINRVRFEGLSTQDEESVLAEVTLRVGGGAEAVGNAIRWAAARLGNLDIPERLRSQPLPELVEQDGDFCIMAAEVTVQPEEAPEGHREPWVVEGAGCSTNAFQFHHVPGLEVWLPEGLYRMTASVRCGGMGGQLQLYEAGHPENASDIRDVGRYQETIATLSWRVRVPNPTGDPAYREAFHLGFRRSSINEVRCRREVCSRRAMRGESARGWGFDGTTESWYCPEHRPPYTVAQ